MKTNADNRYNLGIRLQMTGELLLEVIGDPVDPDLAPQARHGHRPLT